MTKEEQIKQCEDIIENGGCDGVGNVFFLCDECVLATECCCNYNEFLGAKSKLKELRGENMNIKAVEKFVQSVNESYEKLIKSREEKEIPFVVGGVYELEGELLFLAKVYHSNPKIYWLRFINCLTGWYCGTDEDMKIKLKEGGIKYTGKTLSDLLEGKYV
jgi:hypothetical protein